MSEQDLELDELDPQDNPQDDPQDIEPKEQNLGDDVPLEEEFVVTLGDEQPKPDPQDDEFNGQPAPQWVKDLRKKSRESDRRIKELESQLHKDQKPAEIKLSEKPTLESVGFDSDEYEVALEKWYEDKRKHDEQERSHQEEQQKAEQSWQLKLQDYQVKKDAIKAKVRDFDIAEEQARDTLSQLQQGILINAADNPELLVYHLGKNPEKAKELASITDPIKFAFAAAKIDAQLKVQTRKPQTSPERKVEGSATLSGTVNSRLEALEKEADRTGDRSKVIAYKKSLKK